MPERDADAMLALLGDPEQAAKELRQFGQDLEYFASIREDLLEQHPWQWVAVANGRVVAIEASREALLETLEAQGISRAHAVAEQLMPADHVLIL